MYLIGIYDQDVELTGSVTLLLPPAELWNAPLIWKVYNRTPHLVRIEELEDLVTSVDTPYLSLGSRLFTTFAERNLMLLLGKVIFRSLAIFDALWALAWLTPQLENPPIDSAHMYAYSNPILEYGHTARLGYERA